MSNSVLPLIVRYRPKSFDEACAHYLPAEPDKLGCGNLETLTALQRRVGEAGRPHAYLFTGPSGVGKTTVARIIGSEIGSEILEVDAASNNGIDAMRALMDIGYYMSATASSRMVILDECHMLSRSAWNAALKTLEEPPDHLYLALCTTERYRVPDTVVTRCHGVDLKRSKAKEVENLLLDVIAKEGWAEALEPAIFQLVVTRSEGSPRQALNLLQVCYDAPSLAEAERIAMLQGSSEPMVQILQMLMHKQGGWDSVKRMLEQMSDDDFTEGSLIHACRYLAGAMKHEKTTEGQARHYWDILSYLTQPVHSYDPQSIFYNAVGRVLWDPASSYRQPDERQQRNNR